MAERVVPGGDFPRRDANNRRDTSEEMECTMDNRRRHRARPTAAQPRARGFTLIELVTVLAIAAILLRMAVPGMSRGVAARALAAQASEFMSALRFARSEAVKRGTVVTLCALDGAGASAEPRCQAARTADWRAGWLVFVDPGDRGVLDPGERVLREQQALAHSGGVAGSRSRVSFTAAGFSTDASSHYLFNPSAAAVLDAPPALLVCVSKQGRPRLASGQVCD